MVSSEESNSRRTPCVAHCQSAFRESSTIVARVFHNWLPARHKGEVKTVRSVRYPERRQRLELFARADLDPREGDNRCRSLAIVVSHGMNKLPEIRRMVGMSCT